MNYKSYFNYQREFFNIKNSLYGFGLGKRSANIEEDTSTPSTPDDHQSYESYDRRE